MNKQLFLCGSLCLLILLLLCSGCQQAQIQASAEMLSETENGEASLPYSNAQEHDITNKASEPMIDSGDFIVMNLLDRKTILINKNRMGHGDLYGLDRLDNKWELAEIDAIFDAMKGVWEVGDYIGFVSPAMYCPDLFDPLDQLEDDVKRGLLESYEERIRSARTDKPKLSLSIREHPIEHDVNNEDHYIYANGYYSPVSIVLSTDRMREYYPVLVDQTAISKDFIVEYPVLYVRFFFWNGFVDNGKSLFEQATLVISSDGGFYFLYDGAFYLLTTGS